MVVNIDQEVRKHLLVFLHKVVDQTFTQSEWESFALSVYLNEELESYRSEVAGILVLSLVTKGSAELNLSEGNEAVIKQIISEVEGEIERFIGEG